MNKIKFLIFLILCISACSKYNGIDISHHNDVDWKSVQLDTNIKYCYIKATEGKHWIDPQCLNHTSNAKKSNLSIGYYHYFRTNCSGEEQFNNFAKVLNNGFNLPPAIDVEFMNNDLSNSEEISKELQIMIDLIRKKYNCVPFVYYSLPWHKTKFKLNNCQYWMRAIEFPFIHGHMRQVGIKHIGNSKIDINYYESF